MALALRVDPGLFYPATADDPRLGDRVRLGPASGGIALLGYADDRAVVNGRGRAGAASGPAEARRFLYGLTPGDRGELERLALFDLGDAALPGAAGEDDLPDFDDDTAPIQDGDPADVSESPAVPSIEELHASIEEAALAALRSGACVVLLGGGHDGAYGSHSALLRAISGRVGAVNVDAHLDVGPLREGKITSGSPFRRLAERWRSRYGLVELGIQPQHNARTHRTFCDEHGFPVVTLAEAREGGVPAAFSRALRQDGVALAVRLDLHSVQATSAPGVSAPCADGLAPADLLACARLAGRDARVRVLDVMELSPPHDADGRTARLAAAVVWSFFAGIAER